MKGEETVSEDRLSNLLFNKPKEFAEKLKQESEDTNALEDRKAAWVDEDDEEFDATTIHKANKKGLYKDTLKRKYETLVGTPSWARLDKKVKTEDEEDDSLLRTVGFAHNTKSATLPKGYLETKLFPKLRIDGDKRIISCLEFHPTASVTLIGTHSGNASLFSVGGDVNNKLHSFRLTGFKITAANFTPDGNEAFICTNKHTYCVYDLMKAEPNMVSLPSCIKLAKLFVMSPNGKYLAVSAGFEEVFIISAASKELIRELKHNSTVHSLVFSSNSDKIYSYCEQGEVCVWDMSTFRVIKKFSDFGCITASTIAASPCGRLLATGSGEGIVNIYEMEKITDSMPQPLKTIGNLKTKITNLKFNASSEILSLASNICPDAVKLVQIPSYHVFANFPPQQNSMKNIQSVNFSPNSGFMGIANDKGCVQLFRLKHYNNY